MFSGSKQEVVATGLFFREGSYSKAHVTGAIQWHVTVPAIGGCMPVLEDALYVGMGIDEADMCGNDGVDLDLGIVLYQCAAQAGSDALGEFKTDSRHCKILDHRSWYNWKLGSTAREWVMYSGDNQGGDGEGDDEWMFLRLDGIKQVVKATHVAITTHIYGCEKNKQADVKFSDLEGAFMRFVAGPADLNNFRSSETIGYVDLDAQFARTSKKGGLVAVLFLDSDGSKKGGEPASLNLATVGTAQAQPDRHDVAAASGQHWQIVAMDLPLANGKELRECLDAVTQA